MQFITHMTKILAMIVHEGKIKFLYGTEDTGKIGEIVGEKS